MFLFDSLCMVNCLYMYHVSHPVMIISLNPNYRQKYRLQLYNRITNQHVYQSIQDAWSLTVTWQIFQNLKFRQVSKKINEAISPTGIE